MIRTGTTITSHHLLEGDLQPREYYGKLERANASKTALKRRLQNSKQRKAPITLATTPFDHREECS